jgi:hypothetical protein
MESNLIMDSSNAKLIPYFGHQPKVIIHHHVQILCSSRFAYAESLGSIIGEPDSELTLTESTAFSYFSVK